MLTRSIQHWGMVERAIHAQLTDTGYDIPTAVVRHFDGHRLSRVLRTGTDRTKSSTVWAHEFDSAGSKPSDLSRLTYAWTIDLDASPFNVIRNHGPTDFHPVVKPTEGLSIYDARKLHRVSECEYHFMTDPLDALVGVIVTPWTSSADNRLQEMLRNAAISIREASVELKHRYAQRQLDKDALTLADNKYISEEAIDYFD